MHVWVEPLEWEGEGDRPIAQLDVAVTNYLDEKDERGPRAVSTAGKACSSAPFHFYVPLCRQSNLLARGYSLVNLAVGFGSWCHSR
jgi:hypothetical protein